MGLINWLKNKFKFNKEKKQDEQNVVEGEVSNTDNNDGNYEPSQIGEPKEEKVKESSFTKGKIEENNVIPLDENLNLEQRNGENQKEKDSSNEGLNLDGNKREEKIEPIVEQTNQIEKEESQQKIQNNEVNEEKLVGNPTPTDNENIFPIQEDENKEEKKEYIEEKHEEKLEKNISQDSQAIESNEHNEVNVEEDNQDVQVSEKELEDIAIYNSGLEKSRNGFSIKLNKLAKKYKEANSEYFDELEECLIESDVGVSLAIDILRRTEDMAAQQHLSSPEDINNLMIDNMFMDYATKGKSFKTDIEFSNNEPTVLMMVGVNGTGKTTTIAKLAQRYKEKGKKILLVAADTFRAGAVEQIKIWANRVGVDIFERGQGAEPASVCYDAIKKAIDEKYDLVIIDTAGRLHTKDYLMNELGKVQRVIGKVLPSAPQETWLALDANTGQNGIQQAKVFKEVCNLTGIVITKMDGTSKGGIILAIRDQLGIPVRFIGLGEHEHDLKEFDLDKYLYGLLIGKGED